MMYPFLCVNDNGNFQNISKCSNMEILIQINFSEFDDAVKT